MWWCGRAAGAHRGEVRQLGEVVIFGQAWFAFLAMSQEAVVAQLLGDAVLQARGCGDGEPACPPFA